MEQTHLDQYNNNEQIVWKGKSSQLLNFKHFSIALIIIIAAVWTATLYSNYLLLIALIALLYAFYQFLIVNSASYTITNQRIVRRMGLFNRTTFEIELYRVKDVHLYEPLHLRLFGLGTISLISSQRREQIFEIIAVSNAAEIREQLRHLVEKRRNEKGVGEYDTN